MNPRGDDADLSLYIHIPFCTHRCAYCDFNTYAGQEGSIPAYVDALRTEIEFVGSAAVAKRAVHTVFFGGGTPSLLSVEQMGSLLEGIRCNFELAETAEITMEANPGTVTTAQLERLRALGVNRISFGAQSANEEELCMLERAHSFLDVMEAVAAARHAGFDNLNLDLIYGLPEQALDTWKTTVERVLDLNPEHISAYALTLEHGTPFGRWSARGLMPTPDPDAAADMYEWGSERLKAAGYVQYEISNWARHQERDMGSSNADPEGKSPGLACKHNLQYWRGLPYLGLGAGAHGYASGYRYSNVLRIKSYIERMRAIGERGSGNRERSEEFGLGAEPGTMTRGNGRAVYPSIPFPLSPAAVNHHRQTVEDDMSEFMIMGLRLTLEGVETGEFRKRFDRGIEDVYGSEIDDLVQTGLLECLEKEISEPVESSEIFRLTSRGRLLGNQAFMRFV